MLPDQNSIIQKSTETSTETNYIVKRQPTVQLIAGISAPLLATILAVLIIIIIALCWIYKRKFVKHEQDHTEQQDGSYTTLNLSQINPSSDHIYTTIQSSHPMSQNSILPVANEMENISPTPSLNPIYSSVDSERPHPPNQGQWLGSQPNQDTISMELAYAVVDESYRKRDSEQDENSHDGTVASTKYSNKTDREEGATVEEKQAALEEMYAVVNKKQKISKDDIILSIPPHNMVEELSTTVIKGSIADSEEEAPPIPPHNYINTSIHSGNY